MNVLVYSSSDTHPTSLTDTLVSLRTLLAPNYAVQTVGPQALALHPWAASCALFVIPSLHQQAGSIASNAAKGIQDYVSGGGRLLALGTGVRVQRRTVDSTFSSLSLSERAANIGLSDLGGGTETRTASKLTLEDTRSGLLFLLTGHTGTDTDREGIGNTLATVQIVDGTRVEDVVRAGAVDLSHVQDANLEAGSLQTIAHFMTPDAEAETRPVSGLKTCIGRGSAVLWAVRLEGPLRTYKDDQGRLQFLRYTLEGLELNIPSPDRLPQGTARPTAQILSASPWRAGVVDEIVRALQVPDISKPYELKDSNDTFLLYSPTNAERIGKQREATVDIKETDDSTTWNPKHIIVYGDGAVPPPALTPRFNIATYYQELSNARKERGYPEIYGEDSASWGVGEALLYGEVVTSTQTMLDKNTRLLTTLPTPLLSLASAQLTGRGRGTNVWLSPPGCLQFSLLLRVPLATLPAPKLVFVQYLFALAVTEACRADGIFERGDAHERERGTAGARLRIKWPNDLYAVMRDGEKRKIGGVLVNTSFGAGKIELVIGCGLNVLNAPPIPSLAQLLPEGAPPPTMERTLATIMAHFERMWTAFLAERGSFAPFMDLYLDRWLHSDQLVTLTTVTPARQVRIVGITPDHGLLRTLPERGGWTDGGGVEYIDLQPDGNSFDLMAGLIKTKN